MVYQMGDNVGGLVFLIVVIASLTIIGMLLYRAFNRKTFLRHGAVLSGLWALYVCAIAIAGAMSTEQLIPLGSTECFDDWCASVVSATYQGRVLTLEVRVSNEAKRVAQTPDHPNLIIIDRAGMQYPPLASSSRALDRRLEAGEIFTTQLSYELRGGQTAAKALLTEGSGPPLIGDQNSFLHKKTYFELKPGM